MAQLQKCIMGGIIVYINHQLSLTLSWVWWGRCVKNYLPKEEGREGGEKKARSVPAGPGARTRDLLHARRGSRAARQWGYSDK